MSIFPRRLRPGGIVVVHYAVDRGRDASEAPCLLQAAIVDPAGRRRSVVSRYVWLPPGFAELRRRDVERHLPRVSGRGSAGAAGGLATSTPLLMLGDLLGGSRDLFGALARFTGGLHCYATYRVPRTAPLGRYRVALDTLADGFATPSLTRDHDFFLVEELYLERRIARGGQQVALVRNPSPEPVPAHLVDITAARDGRPRYRERTIELAPEEVSEIRLRGRSGFLFYGEYREILMLDRSRAAVCIRNPRLQWTEDRGTIHVLAADSTEGAVLAGAAREIWLRAGGYLRRDEVRTARTRRTYDQMLRKKMILEIARPG